MNEREHELREILRRCEESQSRCEALRVRLVLGQVDESEVSREYAVATAPLAAAMRDLAIIEGRA